MKKHQHIEYQHIKSASLHLQSALIWSEDRLHYF